MGFSMSYPEGWTAQETSSTTVDFTSPAPSAGTTSIARLEVRIESLPASTPTLVQTVVLPAAIAQIKKLAPTAKIGSIQQTTLGGETAYQVTINTVRSGKALVTQLIATAHNGKVYVLTSAALTSDAAAYANDLQTMTSSFAFI
jgi:hypothetical protein